MYDLVQHLELIREFVTELESDPGELLKVEVKTRGTLIEQKCRDFLGTKLGYQIHGSAGNGVDLIEFNTDVKSTSVDQPQSSSPYRSVTEKLFGLPHNILLFIYEINEGTFTVEHCVYIPAAYTGCKIGTRLIKRLYGDVVAGQMRRDTAIKALKGWLYNVEGLSAGSVTNKVKKYCSGGLTGREFCNEVEGWTLVEPEDLKPDWDEIWGRVEKDPPEDGVVGYSFALQWRLQYNELAVETAPAGVSKVL